MSKNEAKYRNNATHLLHDDGDDEMLSNVSWIRSCLAKNAAW